MRNTTVAGFISYNNLYNFTDPVFEKLQPEIRERIENVPVNVCINSIGKAGYYRTRTGEINLNRHLKPEDACSTFLHELAHALVYLDHGYRFPSQMRYHKAHGWLWQNYMRQLQQVPERCYSHTYLRDTKAKRWRYTCQKCNHVHESVRRCTKLIKFGVYHRGCGPTGRFLEQRLI